MSSYIIGFFAKPLDWHNSDIFTIKAFLRTIFSSKEEGRYPFDIYSSTTESYLYEQIARVGLHVFIL